MLSAEHVWYGPKGVEPSPARATTKPDPTRPQSSTPPVGGTYDGRIVGLEEIG